MKVIDLLNKIAKGEEVPEEIIYDNITFYYHPEYRGLIRYVNEDKSDNWKYLFYYMDDLNDEVEIIGEEKDIEEIPIPDIDSIENERIIRAEFKINELVREVRKLKNK